MHNKLIYATTLLVALSGAAQAQWAGTNPLTTAGKVGIGTTTPTGKLEVKNTQINDPCLRIVRAIPLSSLSTNTVEIIDGDPSTSPPTTPVKLFWIDNAQRVGIGNLATGGDKAVLADANGILKTETPAFRQYAATSFSCSGYIDMQSNSIGNIGNLNVGAPGSIHKAIGASGFNNISIDNSVGIMKEPDGNVYRLDVNGAVRCVSLLQTSDKRFKKDITPLSTYSSRIYNVNAYAYKFNTTDGKNFFDDKQHFGFIAQELEKELPNLVTKDNEGYYAVNYTEFIPLLLDALKDQKARISSLEDKLAALENKISNMPAAQTSGYNDAPATFKGSVLFQNTPNPFNKETTIRFSIAAAFNAAFIGIYDLNGKQVKRIAVTEANSAITLPARLLAPGTYIYSLVADGQLIDTKKMVVID